MTERVRLRDGTNAVIRPLLPTDREVLREQYEYLSPESRFHRFLTGVPTSPKRCCTAALLEALIRRRPEGIRQILTRVAADNPASLALLRPLGDLTVRPAADGCLDVVVDLPGLSSTAT